MDRKTKPPDLFSQRVGKPVVCLDCIVYTSNTRLEVKCEGETDLYDLTRDELVAVYKDGNLTFT